MNNLFIMRTQYNLIIAVGILKEMYPNDKNDLILLPEFKVSNQFLTAIGAVFSSVTVLPNEKSKKRFEIEKLLYQQLKQAKHLEKNHYDNVFISQDQFFETTFMSKLFRKNRFETCFIEEDCYFSLIPERNFGHPDYEKVFKVKPISFNVKIRNFARERMYGRDIFTCGPTAFYGENENIRTICALYPHMLRSEISDKETLSVTPEMILNGTRLIYSNIEINLEKHDKYLFFLADLIDRYKNIELIEQALGQLVDYCKKNGRKFLYKYHPRETKELKALENDFCVRLPTVIPSERILSELYSNDVVTISTFSQSLQVACRLGFKTISLANINYSAHSWAEKAMKNMGILLPDNIEDITKQLV